MKQPLLITKEIVESYLQVAIGYSTQEFERFIREAQEFDLKALLCEDFYYSLIKNKEAEPYKDIISGKEYDHNEKNYYHEGLESVLSYFAYARFILKANAVSTSHGIVVKKTPHSEPISQAEKKDLYYSHKQDANRLFEGVAKYMDRSKINYNDCNDCGETSIGGDVVTRSMKW